MKKGIITFIAIIFVTNIFGQIIKKYDSSFDSLPMIITSDYVYNPNGGSLHPRIGFEGRSSVYLLTNKALGKYFIKVPESYKIYKKARHHFLLGKLVGFVLAPGLLVTGAALGSHKASTPVALAGLVSLGTGFFISFKGKKIMLEAVPVYNSGLKSK